jgi:hypothetical protein
LPEGPSDYSGEHTKWSPSSPKEYSSQKYCEVTRMHALLCDA